MGQGPTWTPAQREARLSKLVERNRAHRRGNVPYEDKEWLRSRYEDAGMTLRQIAAEAECGLRTIARWVKIHRIPTRQEWPRATGSAAGAWERGGDEIGYSAVHARLRLRRGCPAAHLCERCGEPAQEWAYDHSDPNERRDDPVRTQPYSTDLSRYIPLCTRCHRRFDSSRRAAVDHAAGGGVGASGGVLAG